jgi:hypothetical protein
LARYGIIASVIKGFTFIPLAALLYYQDFGNWINYLSSSRADAFFLAAVSVLGFGLLIKRESIWTFAVLPQSRISLYLGCGALGASILTYLGGSYFFLRSVLHFESFLIFLAGYILLRYNLRLLQVILPVIAMIGFSFSAIEILESATRSGVGLFSLDVLTFLLVLFLCGFFVFYCKNGSLFSSILPSIVFLLSFLYVIAPIPKIFVIIVLAPFALLGLNKRFFQGAIFPSSGTLKQSRICSQKHLGKVDSDRDGFCFACGRKLDSLGATPNSSFFGLVLIVTVVVGLLAIQAPLLLVSGGMPYSASYGYSGVKTAVIPAIPYGWLLNTSIVQSLPGDYYSVEQVYVPSFHPERSNYTVYYELSQGERAYISSSWGQIAGWSKTSESPPQGLDMGPFTGSLITYESSNETMLVLAGTTKMYFLVKGVGFLDLTVGFSLVRLFRTANASAVTPVFVNDAKSFFLPQFNVQIYYSSWTEFFYKASLAVGALGYYLASALVIFATVLMTYRLKLLDYEYEQKLDEVYSLNEQDWILFSKLAAAPREDRTGFEIAELLSPCFKENSNENNMGHDTLERTLNFLLRVEKMGLVKKVFCEADFTPLLVWRLAI